MNDARAAAIRERVGALGAMQRARLADLLAREGVLHGRERLVGFVVRGRETSPRADELREFLSLRLPEHMIPAQFVAVDRIPRTAAGKLDRRALPTLEGRAIDAVGAQLRSVAPRSPLESRLAAIWRDVLKLDDVGIDDDFFEVGGDSLLSIRVIARAGREGIRIAPERFFERPTIRHIADSLVAKADATSGGEPHVDLPAAVGDAPLTPIQHWFLEAVPRDRDWWNQAYVLDVGHPLDAAGMEAIVRVLVRHHAALRLRLVQRDGTWAQRFPSDDEEPRFRAVRLRGLPRAGYAPRLLEECRLEQEAMHIADGGLFRTLYLEGEGEGIAEHDARTHGEPTAWRRLVFLAHHLVVDGVSWQVILEDLATLVTQAASGQPLRLGPPTAPARAWAMLLAERASAPDVARMASYWESMPVGQLSLPIHAASSPRVDTREARHGLNRDAEVRTIALDVASTRQLMHEAARRVDVSVQALLLAALLTAWRDWGGEDTLQLDVEGHGRDVLGGALDVSRTVGWFTTVFPVHLDFPASPSTADALPASAVAQQMQRVLDALPLRGAAHGLLRHLAPDGTTRRAFAARARPDVLFNHLGSYDVTLPAPSRLRLVHEPLPPLRSPEAVRPYALELNSRIERGQLIVAIEFARGVHRPEAIERLVAALRGALEAMAGAGTAAFGMAAMDASTLETVAGLLDELDGP